MPQPETSHMWSEWMHSQCSDPMNHGLNSVSLLTLYKCFGRITWMKRMKKNLCCSRTLNSKNTRNKRQWFVYFFFLGKRVDVAIWPTFYCCHFYVAHEKKNLVAQDATTTANKHTQTHTHFFILYVIRHAKLFHESLVFFSFRF